MSNGDNNDAFDRRRTRPKASVISIVNTVLLLGGVAGTGFGAAVYLDAIRWDVLTVQDQVKEVKGEVKDVKGEVKDVKTNLSHLQDNMQKVFTRLHMDGIQ